MKRRSPRERTGLNRTLISFAVASCFAAEFAHANPTGPSVAAGAASFNTVGSSLTVTNTPNAIINWRGFSIGAGEITRFQQQSASSAVLNRVVGQDPSAILGTLWSNGKVFLVNPNGILFGQGSRIDVAGLVASTLNISDSDFLGGKLNFKAGAVANSIVNQGELHSSSGGNIYLIASDVTNSGLISSTGGEVILAAGKSVSLVDAQTPNLKVEVSASDGQARNIGQIVADSGRIGVYAGLVNQQGTVRADSVEVGKNGEIVFRASKDVTLAAGSVTSASGASGGVHDGGAVRVLSDGTIDAQSGSLVRAEGGPSGGNGGFLELSGKGRMQLAGSFSARALAPRYLTGTILLDPENVDIVSGACSVNLCIDPTLAPGTAGAFGNGNVVVVATGDLRVLTSITNASLDPGASLQMDASNNLTVSAAIGTAGTRFDHDLTLRAGNDVLINNNIYLGNRTLTLAADVAALDLSRTIGGSPAPGPSGVGNVNILPTTAAVTVDTLGNLNVTGVDFNLRGGGSAGAFNGDNIDRSVTVNANAISVNAAGSILVAGGDNPVARASGAGTNTAALNTNATLNATTTLSLTAGGGITIRGGRSFDSAGAFASSGNNNATNKTNALVTAGGAVTITAGTVTPSTLTIAGGSALQSKALAAGSNTALTSANATVRSTGGSVSLSAPGGTVQISGGDNTLAVAGLDAMAAGPLAGNNTATTHANALVQSATSLTISNASTVTINGGSSAKASAWKWAPASGANITGTLTANANANATLSAGSSLSINLTPGNVTLDGRRARALASEEGTGVVGSAMSGTNTATANSNISLTGGTGLSINVGNGSLTVNMGRADASAFKTVTGASNVAANGNNAATANATTALTASTGNVTIAGGSFTVNSNSANADARGFLNGGSANAAAGANNATANATLNVAATAGDMTLTIGSGGMSVFGNSASANARHFSSGFGHSMTTNNTAVADASITFTAAGNLTVGYPGPASNAGPFRIDAGRGSASGYKSVAGDNNNITGTNSATLTANVRFQAGSGALAIRGSTVAITGGSEASPQAYHYVVGNNNIVGGNNSATSNVKIILSAGGPLTLAADAGGLNIGGNSASASASKAVNGGPPFNTVSGTNNATADSSISITSGGNLAVSATGGVSISAGRAGASATHNVNGTGHIVSGDHVATADASVTLSSTGGTLQITGTSLDISARSAHASAGRFLSSASAVNITGDNTATANSGVTLSSLTGLTVNVGSGPMSVFGDSARASAGKTLFGNNGNSVGGNETAIANSKINVGATAGSTTITVGSLSVSGSSARASATKTANSPATANTLSGTHTATADSTITLSASGTLSIAASAVGGIALSAGGFGGATAIAQDAPNGNSITGVNSANAAASITLSAANLNLNLSNTAAPFGLTDGSTSVTGTGVAASKAQLLSPSAITVISDNMNIAGAVNAGTTGTVTLAPFTTSRNVNVELSPTGGVLSLSPTALGNVTAGTLVLGGTSGTLTVGSGTSVSAPNVTLIADHMSIQGTVNATAPSTGVAMLSTFSPGANIDLKNSSGCSFTVSDPLCIGPADLQKITASTVMLTAPSGIVYLDNSIASSDVNASTLRIVADSIYENGGGGIGSIPTPFDRNLFLEAGNNIQLLQTNIFVADNRDVRLLANLGNGAGTLDIKGVTVQAGPGATNTFGLTLQGAAINIGDASAATLTNVNTSGNLTVNATGILSLRGSDLGAPRYASLASNGDQNITAAGISVIGGDGGTSTVSSGAIIVGNANQTLTVGSSGLTLLGGGGTGTDVLAMVRQAGGIGTSQTITVNGGGMIQLQGGSSPLTNVGAGHGSGALITATGSSQTIQFSAGGGIHLDGGTVGSRNNASIAATNGTQTIGVTTGATLYPTIVVVGGDSGGFDAAGEGNSASITAAGLQTIRAGNVTVAGGIGGILNSGSISAPTQDITVHGDLQLLGQGAAAGVSGGAGARIGGLGGASATATNLTLVVDNDVTLTGGSVSGLTGSAIGSTGFGTAFPNTITMNVGRDLTLNQGTVSGARIGASTGNLASGDLSLTVGRNVALNGGTSIATSGMLTLDAAGALAIVGSNTGAGQRATLLSIGTQNITAASITLHGGDNGGADLNGNFAQISGGATQTITTTGGDLVLTAGAAGINNFASITAPTQIVTVHGNLSLNGGGSATSVDGTIGGGARIGGPGGASPVPTNLTLNVDGTVHMTGGTLANAGTAIGSGAQGGQATAITMTAGGNVTLDPGTMANAGSRIGSPASSVAGGDIAITFGGTLALNSSGPGLGTAIRTLGNVTLHGGSVTEGPDSQIVAGGTSTITGATVSLPSVANQFGTLLLATTGDATITDADAINLGTSSTGSGGLTVIAPGGITQSGPITAGAATFDAGAASITLTNSGNDFTGPVDIATTGTAAITDANAFTIKGGGGGGSNPSSLTINANGAVTQSAAFTGSAPTVITINAGTGPVTLNNASNNFSGNTSASINTTGAVSVTNNNPGGINLGTSSVGGALALTSGGPVTQSGPITVGGTSTINAGANAVALTNAANDFTGAVNFTGSNVSLTDANAISIGNSNASGSLSIVSTSTSFLNGLSANNYSFSGGTYTLAAGTYNLSGTTSVAQSPVTGVLTVVDLQTGATINTSGGTVNVGTGGTLKGLGTIQGNVNNTAGTVAPGASPGALTITGNYTQGASGVLNMEIGGLSAGTQYDQLVVGGATSLAGTLNTTLVGGFVPVAGDTFTLIRSTGPITGTFTTINQPAGTLFNSFYGPTTFDFVAASAASPPIVPPGTVPEPIQPAIQNVIVSTEQVLTSLNQTTTNTTSETGLKFVPGGNIDVAPATTTTATTADGKIVPKPPACN